MFQILAGNAIAQLHNEYKESIHGVAVLQKGNLDAPVCTNCHGEHNIMSPSNPNAPTSYANVAQHVCAKCHSSVALSTKYGLIQIDGPALKAATMD